MTTTPDLSHFPPGSTVERLDGKTVVWYPKPERVVVRFVVAPCFPTCQRAMTGAAAQEATR